MPQAPTDLLHRTSYDAPDTRSAVWPSGALALAPELTQCLLSEAGVDHRLNRGHKIGTMAGALHAEGRT